MKKSFGKRLNYWFDCIMSKGPVALSLLLFAMTAVIVGLIGIIAYFVSDDGSLLYQLWSSLMYTLDAGNLASVPTDNILYLILMFLATLCGLFLTSILIGIIATTVENKLDDLRKGTSVVQESNHTVIIGFDNNVHEILRELIEANANHKKQCVVVLGQESKELMEDTIKVNITHSKTTRIICRSGNLYETYSLKQCSVETAKSVIINVHNDAETIKILLALSTYVKNKALKNPNLRFIASLQEQEYVEAADIAGEGRAAIIFAKDAIARIIANTCRQHGLSQVLSEFFDFEGDELYFENVPELRGKTFKEATLSFSNATAIGIHNQGVVKMNPPMDQIIGKNDQIILLESDDGEFHYHPAKTPDATHILNTESRSAATNNNLLVLGTNSKLPIVLEEYSKYVTPGTRIIIVDDDFDERNIGTYDNLEISVCTEKITHKLLCHFLGNQTNNVLLLNDDSCNPEISDSHTLLRLILLRDISDKLKRNFSITTEMCNVDSQRLASQSKVDDFVIGSNFISLMMIQISENPNIMPLINELLDEEGSELYMKPAADYVTPGVPVNSYTLTESAARKGEIYIGYRHVDLLKPKVITNPPKDELIVFGEHDQIVVIAEN